MKLLKPLLFCLSDNLGLVDVTSLKLLRIYFTNLGSSTSVLTFFSKLNYGSFFIFIFSLSDTMFAEVTIFRKSRM